jgi:subtilisin family serine protease/subtilisin-like proprotein convertase family protein
VIEMPISNPGRCASKRARLEPFERRVLLASLSGQVFYDENLDGIIGPRDNGLEGWSVFADLNGNQARDTRALSFDSSDTPLAMTEFTVSTIDVIDVGGIVADVDIEIHLIHPSVGDLDLTLVAPDGSRITLGSYRGGTGANFNGTIFDDSASRPWNRVNHAQAPFSGRFVPEQSLTGLAGVPVDGLWQLEIVDAGLNPSGTLLEWQLHVLDGEPADTSDSAGYYDLRGIPVGAVDVLVEAPAGWQVHRNPAGVTFVDPWDDLPGVHFGVRLPPATVAGAVFADHNRNGVREPAEPGIAGRTVFIDANNNQLPDSNELTAVTDDQGAYAFSNLRPGEARVRQVLPHRWSQTGPASLSSSTSTTTASSAMSSQAYLPDRLIVAVGKSEKLDAALRKVDNRSLRRAAPLVESIELARLESGLRLLQVPVRPGSDPLELSHRLQSLPGVAWAEPDFVYTQDPRDYTPDDPQFASQYHHSVMHNPQAWDLTQGQGIVVAVADDGVMLNHPDLAPNIWVNSDEVANNGIDDDNNGYIDDINGWDFTNSTTPGTGDNNPNPVISGDDHGTHVAGIVAARTNNHLGVAGTAGLASIMPLRFFGSGAWTSTVIFNTYKYAADNGAHIVTTSYNVDGFAHNALYRSAIDYLYTRGVLHLNSAGNTATINPARQVIDGTLYVASTDASDFRSGFSNYGTGIDLAAPGTNILSTAIGSSLTTPSYELKSGTSMAAPNAAGVAALIWASNPTWTRDQVAAQLLGSAEPIDQLNPFYAGMLGSGRVHSQRALTGTIAPPSFGALNGLPAGGQITPVAPSSFTLRFVGVFDAASVNRADAFRLEGAGPDDRFGTADDVSVTLSRSVGDYRIGTNQITFTLASPLDPGSWRFIADASILQDPFGLPLDGNSDGNAGDNLTRTFQIAHGSLPNFLNLQAEQLYQADFGAAENSPPTVLESVFQTQTDQFVSFTFSEPVDPTPLTIGAVSIVNTITNEPLDPSIYTYSYDALTRMFRLGFSDTLIPEGDYRATLNPDHVLDAFGNALDGDDDGLAGGTHTVDFFFKNADFNRDRSTNFDDLLILAQNYGTSDATFAQGDANLDGTVDFDDLLMTAQSFNTSLVSLSAMQITRPSRRERTAYDDLI